MRGKRKRDRSDIGSLESFARRMAAKPSRVGPSQFVNIGPVPLFLSRFFQFVKFGPVPLFLPLW
jgi:hypothetical protein